MNSATAKRRAKKAHMELWYDRHERLWVLQDHVLIGSTRPTTHISPGALRVMTDDQFDQFYLQTG